MDRVLHMIVCMVMRRLMRQGVNKGIDMMAQRAGQSSINAGPTMRSVSCVAPAGCDYTDLKCLDNFRPWP